MADIIIPEAVWNEFLQSLHAKVTKDREELVAEMVTDLALLRARLEVETRAAFQACLDAEEAALELKLRALEEDRERIERKMRAAEEQIECKLRAAEDEIARLRQLERLRITYEAEPQDEGSQLQ